MEIRRESRSKSANPMTPWRSSWRPLIGVLKADTRIDIRIKLEVALTRSSSADPVNPVRRLIGRDRGEAVEFRLAAESVALVEKADGQCRASAGMAGHVAQA